ncbi:hypothetical protein JCM19233_1855 [Vibrio astriarenae]|nr:hypothetical protein JCM19233_1855 [Vibrio sp. C7]
MGISRQSSAINVVLVKNIGSNVRVLIMDFILIPLFVYEE